MSGISVTATVEVPLGKLVEYPHNPRRGEVDRLVESIEAHGQYRALVVNKRTMQVLAGNHTLKALRKTGAAKALVHYVDVDEVEAKKIVLADNRLSDLAGYDDQALAVLLSDLPDLDATGYEQADLDSLLAKLAGPADPDPQQIPETFDVIVSCESEDTQIELLERLTEEGLTCKALVS